MAEADIEQSIPDVACVVLKALHRSTERRRKGSIVDFEYIAEEALERCNVKPFERNCDIIYDSVSEMQLLQPPRIRVLTRIRCAADSMARPEKYVHRHVWASGCCVFCWGWGVRGVVAPPERERRELLETAANQLLATA